MRSLAVLVRVEDSDRFRPYLDLKGMDTIPTGVRDLYGSRSAPTRTGTSGSSSRATTTSAFPISHPTAPSGSTARSRSCR